jgi:3',5'-cyclic-AMP phosphodiesterase
MFKPIRWVWVIASSAAIILTGCSKNATPTQSITDPYQIVVLSDVHLPGKNLQQKESALSTIQKWDVDLVVVTGDIVATGGDPSQYAAAQKFFDRLTKPIAYIGGNHDYIYPDTYPVDPNTGHHVKETSPDQRKQKLDRFKKNWRLEELYYSRILGEYLLIFLTPDELSTNNYAQMTDQQLEWLKAELKNNSVRPTIIFFHAPLEGTYSSIQITQSKSPDSYNAEPAGAIRRILSQNPQVFLWVAGHLHLAPSNKDFNSEVNWYENRVLVVHNPDMNGSSIYNRTDTKSTLHQNIWTNSLFLYPDRVVVKTYDHTKGEWIVSLTRIVTVPKKPL